MNIFQIFVEMQLTITKIFENASSDMVMSAYYYLRDKDWAKDVVADCFERLLKAERSGAFDISNKSMEDLRSWLFAILRNRCLDELKIKKNRSRLLSFIDFNGSDSNNWIEKAESEALKTMLKFVPIREAEVFELYLKGYSYDEIANTIGTSTSTIKNQLHSVKKKLRTLLKLMTLLIVSLFYNQ